MEWALSQIRSTLKGIVQIVGDHRKEFLHWVKYSTSLLCFFKFKLNWFSNHVIQDSETYKLDTDKWIPVSSNVKLGRGLEFFFSISMTFFFPPKQNLTWTPNLYKISRSGAGGSCSGESVMELGPLPTWSPPWSWGSRTLRILRQHFEDHGVR